MQTRLRINASALAAIFVLLLSVHASAQDDPQLTLDQTASVLAGMEVPDHGLSGFSSFTTTVNTAWESFIADYGEPMSTWSAETLEYNAGERVFYPFSGPDFVTVHRFYPDATHYVMIAKQRGGRFPDLHSSTTDVDGIKEVFEEATVQFADIGFFITAEINEQFDYGSAVVEGLSIMIGAMAVREGFTINSLEPIRINSSGEVEINSGDRSDWRTWRSVRFNMTRDSDGQEVLIDYHDLDLSNEHLDSDEASHQLAYIREVAQSRVVFKAASHLPQYGSFSTVVDAILDNSLSIVMDETGPEFREIDEVFETRLFGTFEMANNNFSSSLQPSLVAVFDEREGEPLPFEYGYYKPEGDCIVYAHTRRAAE